MMKLFQALFYGRGCGGADVVIVVVVCVCSLLSKLLLPTSICSLSVLDYIIIFHVHKTWLSQQDES